MDYGELVAAGEEILEHISYRENILSEDKSEILVDFQELEMASPEVADEIRDNYLNAKDAMEEAAIQESEKEDVEVKFHNIPESDILRPQELRAEDIGSFVAVRGLLVNVEERSVKTVSAIFECTMCGARYEKSQESGNLESPYKCEDCAGKEFSLKREVPVDYQEFEVSAEKSIKCIVEGDVIGKKKELQEKEAIVSGRAEKDGNSIAIKVNHVNVNPSESADIQELASSDVLSDLIKESFELDDLDSFLDSLDPLRFEKLLAIIFDKAGWRTELTAATGDRGIDVIARKRFPVKRKYLIQAKCNGEGNRVSGDKVQQYNSLKEQEPNVDQVILATTSYYTSQARELGSLLDIKLLDRDDIKMILDDLQEFEEEGMLEVDRRERLGTTDTTESKVESNMIQKIRDSIEKSIGEDGSAEISKVLEKADEEFDIEEETAEETIEKLKREGELFEPEEGHIQRI